MEEIKVEIFDDYCKEVSADEVSALLKKVAYIIAEAKSQSIIQKSAYGKSPCPHIRICAGKSLQ